jgi:hypothetical protein
MFLSTGVSCLAIVAVLLGAVAVSAAPQRGYIGLFADEYHATCDVINTSGSIMYPFTLWIWCLPSVNGMIAAEFAISFPGIVIPSVVTLNPLIAMSLGTLWDGTSVAFGTCNNDWVWTHHVDCYLTSTTLGDIRIIPDPKTQPPAYQFYACTLGNPPESISKLTDLNLNYADCFYATKDESWGAIKELFK